MRHSIHFLGCKKQIPEIKDFQNWGEGNLMQEAALKTAPSKLASNWPADVFLAKCQHS